MLIERLLSVLKGEVKNSIENINKKLYFLQNQFENFGTFALFLQ